MSPPKQTLVVSAMRHSYMDYVEGETAITRCGHTYIHFTGINCYFKGDYSTVSVQYPGSSMSCSGDDGEDR